MARRWVRDREDTMTMARDWKEVRAQALATGKLDEQRIAELGAKLRAEVRAHRLAEIRQAYGMDQSTLAIRLGVSQSRISRLERGELDRSEIATVRSYVEALVLGGQIEVIARFGDEHFAVG
jgi:predicted transcriptional regulator